MGVKSAHRSRRNRHAKTGSVQVCKNSLLSCQKEHSYQLLHIFFLDTQTWTGQCVQDSSKRLLPKSVSVSSNSPASCMKACKGAGYKFAGVQYSSQCFCGETAPPDSTIKSSVECNRVCPGNTGQKCGGSWRMNVYAIGKSKTKSTCFFFLI